MSRLRFPFAAFIAIPFGLVVLLGYFIEIPVLFNLRTLFLRWALIIAAVAIFVGILNLFRVHWRRVTTRQPRGAYSLSLIIALIATIVFAGILSTPTTGWGLWIFNYIQLPVESSLMAILAVVLIYAAARLLSRRLNAYTILFLLTVLIVLAGSVSLPYLETNPLGEVQDWVAGVLATAGARGILLGVALGTVATGLRVLMGADRPYGG